jgi:hypothetical protein
MIVFYVYLTVSIIALLLNICFPKIKTDLEDGWVLFFLSFIPIVNIISIVFLLTFDRTGTFLGFKLLMKPVLKKAKEYVLLLPVLLLISLFFI